MRQAFSSLLVLASLCASPNAQAQSTISNSPLELTTSVGVWAALLPDYELGTNGNGAPAFRDNMDDVGFIGQLKLVRRFLGTRTSFETKGFYAFADSESDTGVIGANVPNPATGANNVLASGGTRLESDTNHYGVDVGLRDTWRTRFGGLSAGASFSYMAFDQQFDVDYGGVRQLREDLDSDYFGGKAFVGWDGCFRNRPTSLDLAIGIYDLEGDYQFSGQAIAGSLQNSLSKTTFTIETTLSRRSRFRGYHIGTTLSAMYISDMTTIQHNTLAPATLGTDDAVTLTALIELML
jgi:hypothetical protein